MSSACAMLLTTGHIGCGTPLHLCSVWTYFTAVILHKLHQMAELVLFPAHSAFIILIFYSKKADVYNRFVFFTPRWTLQVEVS